nr:hypothetical protein [Tanacetum cinerariifolium]
EQWAYLSTHPSKRLHSFCFDDDDDDEDYTSAITPNEPVLSTEELDNSLSMGDEHRDTIPATESDEFIKSSVENLIPIPNQFEDFFESNEEFSSTDDDSFSLDNIDYVEASPPDSELVSLKVMEIVIPKVGGIKTSNDNLISTEEFSSTDDDSFSLDNIDYVEASPPDSGLVSLKVMEIVIPKVGGIKTSNDNLISFYDPIIFGTPPNLTRSGESDFFLETDCDFEEDIHLIEKLLYDNSSPRPPKEFVSANSDAASESFFPFPILVKDSDLLMEEIDLLCTPDYPMPAGIVDKDYDSERDILILKDLPSNNSLSFAEK